MRHGYLKRTFPFGYKRSTGYHIEEYTKYDARPQRGPAMPPTTVSISSDPIDSILSNLNAYTEPRSLLLEVVQNADDAGAQTVVIGWSQNCPLDHPAVSAQPGLWILNDGDVRMEDWLTIPRIGGSSKPGGEGSIGRFGLGLKSVFHLADRFFFAASDATSVGGRVTLADPFFGKDSAPGAGTEFPSDVPALEAHLGAVIARYLCKSPVWFLLWIPLRSAVSPKPFFSVHTPGDASRVAADGRRISSALGLNPHRIAAELRTTLPLLRHVGRISLVELDGTHERETLRLARSQISGEGGLAQSLSYGRGLTVGPPRPFGGTFHESDGNGLKREWRYLGVEALDQPARFAEIRQSPGWPTRRKDENGVLALRPVDADPHVSPVIIWPGDRAPKGLHFGLATFLPLPETFWPAGSLDGGEGRLGPDEITLILHGYFALDSGRGLPQGFESAVRPALVAGPAGPDAASALAPMARWNVDLTRNAMARFPALLDEVEKHYSIEHSLHEALAEGLEMLSRECKLLPPAHRWVPVLEVVDGALRERFRHLYRDEKGGPRFVVLEVAGHTLGEIQALLPGWPPGIAGRNWEVGIRNGGRFSPAPDRWPEEAISSLLESVNIPQALEDAPFSRAVGRVLQYLPAGPTTEPLESLLRVTAASISLATVAVTIDSTSRSKGLLEILSAAGKGFCRFFWRLPLLPERLPPTVRQRTVTLLASLLEDAREALGAFPVLMNSEEAKSLNNRAADEAKKLLRTLEERMRAEGTAVRGDREAVEAVGGVLQALLEVARPASGEVPLGEELASLPCWAVETVEGEGRRCSLHELREAKKARRLWSVHGGSEFRKSLAILSGAFRGEKFLVVPQGPIARYWPDLAGTPAGAEHLVPYAVEQYCAGGGDLARLVSLVRRFGLSEHRDAVRRLLAPAAPGNADLIALDDSAGGWAELLGAFRASLPLGVDRFVTLDQANLFSLEERKEVGISLCSGSRAYERLRKEGAPQGGRRWTRTGVKALLSRLSPEDALRDEAVARAMAEALSEVFIQDSSDELFEPLKEFLFRAADFCLREGLRRMERIDNLLVLLGDGRGVAARLFWHLPLPEGLSSQEETAAIALLQTLRGEVGPAPVVRPLPLPRSRVPVGIGNGKNDASSLLRLLDAYVARQDAAVRGSGGLRALTLGLSEAAGASRVEWEETYRHLYDARLWQVRSVAPDPSADSDSAESLSALASALQDQELWWIRAGGRRVPSSLRALGRAFPGTRIWVLFDTEALRLIGAPGREATDDGVIESALGRPRESNANLKPLLRLLCDMGVEKTSSRLRRLLAPGARADGGVLVALRPTVPQPWRELVASLANALPTVGACVVSGENAQHLTASEMEHIGLRLCDGPEALVLLHGIAPGFDGLEACPDLTDADCDALLADAWTVLRPESAGTTPAMHRDLLKALKPLPIYRDASDARTSLAPPPKKRCVLEPRARRAVVHPALLEGFVLIKERSAAAADAQATLESLLERLSAADVAEAALRCDTPSLFWKDLLWALPEAVASDTTPTLRGRAVEARWIATKSGATSPAKLVWLEVFPAEARGDLRELFALPGVDGSVTAEELDPNLLSARAPSLEACLRVLGFDKMRLRQAALAEAAERLRRGNRRRLGLRVDDECRADVVVRVLESLVAFAAARNLPPIEGVAPLALLEDVLSSDGPEGLVAFVKRAAVDGKLTAAWWLGAANHLAAKLRETSGQEDEATRLAHTSLLTTGPDDEGTRSLDLSMLMLQSKTRTWRRADELFVAEGYSRRGWVLCEEHRKALGWFLSTLKREPLGVNEAERRSCDPRAMVRNWTSVPASLRAAFLFLMGYREEDLSLEYPTSNGLRERMLLELAACVTSSWREGAGGPEGSPDVVTPGLLLERLALLGAPTGAFVGGRDSVPLLTVAGTHVNVAATDADLFPEGEKSLQLVVDWPSGASEPAARLCVSCSEVGLDRMRESAELVLRRAFRTLLRGLTSREVDEGALARALERISEIEGLSFEVARDLVLGRAIDYLEQLRVRERLSAKVANAIEAARRDRRAVSIQQFQARRLADRSLSSSMKRQVADESLERTAKSAIEEALRDVESPDARAVLAAVRERIRRVFQYAEASVLVELFQNADDALTERLASDGWYGSGGDALDAFVVRPAGSGDRGGLAACHWGRPVNSWAGLSPEQGRHKRYDEDIERMLLMEESAKPSEKTLRLTGRFGLGFKSVYLATDEPWLRSGGIAFAIRGGVLPYALGPEQLELTSRCLREVATDLLGASESDSRIDTGTVVMLPSAQGAGDGAPEPLAASLEFFRQHVVGLVTFSHSIRRIVVEDPEGVRVDVRKPVPVEPLPAPGGRGRNEDAEAIAAEQGLAAIGVGRTPLGRRHVDAHRLLVLRAGNCALAFNTGPKGLVRIDDDVSSVWTTTPTNVRLGAGFVLNGPFDLDPGRSQLHADLKTSEAVIDEAVGGLCRSLEVLAELPWGGVAEALGIRAERTTFWSQMWHLLGSGLEKLQRAGGAPAAQLLSRLLWGTDERKGAYRQLLERAPVLPTGLPTADGLTTLELPRMRAVGGILGKERVLALLTSSSFRTGLEGVSPISLAVAGTLKTFLECSIPRIGLGEVGEVALKKQGMKLEPEAARVLGVVREILEGSDAQTRESDGETLRALLRRTFVRTGSGGWVPTGQVLDERMTSVERRRVARLLSAEERLAAEYDREAVSAIEVCSEEAGQDGEKEIGRKVRAAIVSADSRRIDAVRDYLGDGEHRKVAARVLRATPNLSEAVSRDIRERPRNDFTEDLVALGALGRRTEVPATTPSTDGDGEDVAGTTGPDVWAAASVPEAREVLASLMHWWAGSGQRLFEQEQEDYWVLYKNPSEEKGRPPVTISRTPAGGMLPSPRRQWFEAFVFASLPSEGFRGNARSTRQYLLTCRRRNWFVQPETGAGDDRPPLGTIVDEYLDGLAAHRLGRPDDPSMYLFGAALFPAWLFSRFGSVYARSFEKSREHHGASFEGLFDPSANVGLSGTGFAAPTASDVLGIGRHILVRDTVRHRAPGSTDLHPVCFAPHASVVGFLRRIGFGGRAESSEIYSFVSQHHEEDATLGNWFDIPLQVAEKRKPRELAAVFKTGE